MTRNRDENEDLSLNPEWNRLRNEMATLSSENSRYTEYKAKTTKEVIKKHEVRTKQVKFNEELMDEMFDLNNEVKQLTDMNVQYENEPCQQWCHVIWLNPSAQEVNVFGVTARTWIDCNE
eukprot:270913_1